MPTNGRAPALTPRKLLSHVSMARRVSPREQFRIPGICRFIYLLFFFRFHFTLVNLRRLREGVVAQAGLTRLNAEFATKGKIQLVSLGILQRDSI